MDLFYGIKLKDKKNGGDSETKTLIRKTAKALRTQRDRNTVSSIVENSIPTFKSNLDSPIDTIVVPASGSGVNGLIAKRLSEEFPSATILTDVLVKAECKDVEINKNITDGETDKKGGLNALGMLASKALLHPHELFEIKKCGGMSYRRYFCNFYKIREDRKEYVRNHLLNKNICVIDDTFEEGATFRDIMRELSEFKPKSTIGYILLEGS